jgi:hypothetical protein
VPQIGTALLVVAFAIMVVLALFFGWHIVSGLFPLIGTLVGVAISKLSSLIQIAVTVATGAVVIGATLLIALGIAGLVWLAFERAIESIAARVRQFSDEAKTAAADATALAFLAGLIGVLAYLTGDFLATKELSLPKMVTVSSMLLVLLKMALYVNSKPVRRAVWPLLSIAYVMPFAFGYYIYDQECALHDNSRIVVQCLLDLKPPKGQSEVVPTQLAGNALIALLAGFAMVFPFSMSTWKRFLGR